MFVVCCEVVTLSEVSYNVCVCARASVMRLRLRLRVILKPEQWGALGYSWAFAPKEKIWTNSTHV